MLLLAVVPKYITECKIYDSDSSYSVTDTCKTVSLILLVL